MIWDVFFAALGWDNTSNTNYDGVLAVKMFITGLVLALFLVACETMETAGMKNQMNFDLKAYGHEVRWGQIEALPSYLKPDMMEGQPAVARNPENIRVTGYETLVSPHEVGEGGKRVAQTVRIHYVFRDRQVVRSLVDEQLWEYDAEAKRWYRSNPIPVFR